MGFWNLFRKADMTGKLEEFRENPGAVLVDVRTAGEYAGGHIPGSKNVDLTELHRLTGEHPDRETPVYLYCLSGARSGFAAEELRKMGYTRVTDLGGINGYHGKVEQ